MSTIAQMTDRHQAPSYPLRMPAELKELVASAAHASGRSMHAELIHRLQRSFQDEEDNILNLMVSQEIERQEVINQEVMAAYKVALEKEVESVRRENERLREQLEDERMNVLREQYEVLKMQNSAMDNENILYILLDSNGLPIAWEEIYAYLDEIRRLGGKLPERWDTSIITPAVENDSQKAKQVMLLTRKLRNMGVSQAISRVSRLQLPRATSEAIEDATIVSENVQGQVVDVYDTVERQGSEQPSSSTMRSPWFIRGFVLDIFSVVDGTHEVHALTITDSTEEPDDATLIYNQIEMSARMCGATGTVWLDVLGDVIPTSVKLAIKNLVGFGVGLVVTLKGRSTLSSPEKFSPELMLDIKYAMRGGLVWCPFEQKLMHAPHGLG